MAISTHFQSEVNQVDPSVILQFNVDTNTHGEFEFSYDGLNITGGSELACEYGASEWLEAKGFRHYMPDTGLEGNLGRFIKRPNSIVLTGTKAKTSFWMKNNYFFLVYGHSWDNIHANWRTLLGNAYAKWATLNSVQTNVFPAGHRHGNVISGNMAFFQANPQLVKNGLAALSSPTSARFNLPAIKGTADWDLLVHICAAHLLHGGLNAWNRTNFDPNDGDDNTSDDVFEFSRDVCILMRAGTDPIATIPAKAGVPNAQIGVYAYAGHRLPPTINVAPYVYTQVALAFNDTDLTFDELIQLHGEQAAAIFVREYLDTQVWSHSQPMSNSRAQYGGLDMYDRFINYGVIGSTCECTANWLVNILMMRYAVRKFKTGTYTMQDAKNDVIGDIFNDDPAVHNLYNLWSSTSSKYNRFTLRKSFDYVNAMQAGWYKDYFEQLVTIMKLREYLPEQTPLAEQTPSDPFPAAFSKYMRFVVGVARSDITHSYAAMRQDANAAMSTNYAYLRYTASPRPDWFLNPAVPTHADFLEAYGEILADTPRDDVLDEAKQILITNVNPVGIPSLPATKVYTEGQADYLYFGPGRITQQRPNEEATIVEYPAGENNIHVSGGMYMTPDKPLLFLDTHTSVRKDPDGTGRAHYIYVPQRVAGNVKLKAGSRWRFYDEAGQFNLAPAGSADYQGLPNNLGPGQVTVENVNTRGTLENYNLPRWLSMHPNYAIVSETIANEDFPGRSKVKRI